MGPVEQRGQVLAPGGLPGVDAGGGSVVIRVTEAVRPVAEEGPLGQTTGTLVDAHVGAPAKAFM